MNTTPHADDLYVKFCKVADVNDESTINDISIEGDVLSVCHSFREYWTTHQ